MTALHISAHELTRTRLCQAANCGNDAEPGWALCRWCDRRWRRGAAIVMHIVEQPKGPDPETELLCTRCCNWKVDDLFARSSEAKGRKRRGRKSECKLCDTERRRLYRASLTPEQRAAEVARDRVRRQRRNAARGAA